MVSIHTGALTPFHLTICGLDELPRHRDAAVSHVLSILDPETPPPAILRAFDGLRAHWVLRFHDVSTPVPGARLPETDDVAEVLTFGREVNAGRGPAHLLVHCHAGVSRSTAAAAILLAQPNPGREREAIDMVTSLRPMARPNRRMLSIADDLLGRRGALVSAADRA